MSLHALVALFLAYRASAIISSSGCLCTSDQSCWPSADDFSQLESQLSQPLVYPRPTAFPCYPPSDPSGDCAEVIANFNNNTWRSLIPGSMILSNWETYTFPNGTLDACFLNMSITGTCEQGRVPVIGVDARLVADVQAAIQFAVEYGLKLVVKNTGHDFIGRSAARGSFVVWTHNMKDITYDATFLPQGAPEDVTYEAAMTLGAGVQWFDAYAAANEQGRLVIGGASVSVGAAGGWLLGGGHSPLSTSYGLGVDNVLEISVVLSTGEYMVANEYQNKDIFWAMRGGGGGTYGIVTSVTYRTYPMVPTLKWMYDATVTNTSVILELVEEFLRCQDELGNEGWGGYGELTSQGISFSYYGPNMTNETAAGTMQAWQNFTASLAPYGVESESTTSYYSSWYDALLELLYNPPADDSGNIILATRLISRDSIANNVSNIAPLLMDCRSGLNLVAGGKVSQFKADSVGLNPLWRNAVAEVTCGTAWNDTTPPTDVQELTQFLEEWIQDIHDATPDDGAYFNEASPFEIDWQYTFFGDHYSQLKSIKNKYDPHGLFVVHQGVGSEDWNEDLTCR